MPVSGTVTYRPTIGTVITDALIQVGAIDPESGLSATTAQNNMGLRLANSLLKFWGTRGIQLWEQRWGVVFPQQNQGTFVLGSPGPAGDHACLSSPLNGGFIATTLATGAAAGDSLIDVTSITGQLNTVGNPAVSITDQYNIGIQLDSGLVQWTTVSGAPVGTLVTLANILTDSASSGNMVYCYQTKLIRPLRVTGAFVRTVSGSSDVPCRVMSREEYNMFGQKSSTGTPVQLYYDAQLNSGTLYLYPAFSTVQQLLFIQFEKPIDDLAATTDDFDLPQEWSEALMWNIAWRMCPAYEVPTEKVKQIAAFATMTYEQLDGWDQEPASLFIQPSNWPMMEGNK